MSIRSKIIILNAILFGIILIAFSFVLYENAEHNAIGRLDSELEQYAAAIQRVLSSNLAHDESIDTSDINEIQTEGPRGIHYQLYNQSTQTSVGSILTRVDSKTPNGFSDIQFKNKQYRSLKVNLETTSEMEFTLIAAAPMDIISAGQRNLLFMMILMIPVCLILAGCVSWFILNFAFLKLTQITRTAQNISENNLETQLPLPKVHDEIWMLGKVFNEMLARLNAAFKSQKQFIADASHEIKTPLAIIRSELEYSQRSPLPEAVKESIITSLSETDRLAVLTDGLLTLAKFDSGIISLNLQPVKIDSLLSEIVKLMSGVSQKKEIKLTLQCSESAVINADSEKLTRVILNLLDNAIKFSPNNSTVQLFLTIKQNDPYPVQIAIADKGPGIDQNDISKIFNRFYRSENTRGNNPGSGLGLSISQDLVRLHNGIITVQSELNKGTTFIIKLPGAPHLFVGRSDTKVYSS